MAINDSGIRDTARVLKVSQTTVIETLKKARQLRSTHDNLIKPLRPTAVEIVPYIEEAELDEMWSHVQSRQHER